MIDGAAMSGRALLSPLSVPHETSEGLVHWLHVRTSYKVKSIPVRKAQEKEPVKPQLSPVRSDSCFTSDLAAGAEGYYTWLGLLHLWKPWECGETTSSENKAVMV